MSAEANSLWQVRVRNLLAAGLGSEDIAVTMDAKLEDVQREIQILRESGELIQILQRVPWGDTASRLMKEDAK